PSNPHRPASATMSSPETRLLVRALPEYQSAGRRGRRLLVLGSTPVRATLPYSPKSTCSNERFAVELLKATSSNERHAAAFPQVRIVRRALRRRAPENGATHSLEASSDHAREEARRVAA